MSLFIAHIVDPEGRPVRFLAKSTLFSSPWVGWFVRACGAIPVYRHMDDPTQVVPWIPDEIYWELTEAWYPDLVQGR